MLDLFSWSHILILVVVALVVVGPEDLPKLMHGAGKWVAKARAVASDLRRSLDDMTRQAELDEVRKELDVLKHKNAIADLASPASEVGDDLMTRPSDLTVSSDGAAQAQSAALPSPVAPASPRAI